MSFQAGRSQVNVIPATQVLSGQVVVAVVAAPLAAITPIQSVTIENLNTNAVVWVGNNVAQNYGLRPGAQISLAIDDLNKVYVRGTVGNVITYIAVV